MWVRAAVVPSAAVWAGGLMALTGVAVAQVVLEASGRGSQGGEEGGQAGGGSTPTPGAPEAAAASCGGASSGEEAIIKQQLRERRVSRLRFGPIASNGSDAGRGGVVRGGSSSGGGALLRDLSNVQVVESCAEEALQIGSLHSCPCWSETLVVALGCFLRMIRPDPKWF